MTRVAIAAIDVLLDRGPGKVRVDLEIGARVDPRTMSDAEFEAELLKFAAKVGRALGGRLQGGALRLFWSGQRRHVLTE